MSLQDFMESETESQNQSKESKAKERVCSSCGNSYKIIGNHWGNGCDYPDITEFQYDVINGSILGDGSIQHNSMMTYPQLTIGMRNRKYLEYIESIFQPLTAGVNRNVNCFQIATTPHPDLDSLKWAPRPKSFIPKDLKINSTVIKHWFVQDGGLDWANDEASVQLCSRTFDLTRMKSILDNIGIKSTVLTNRVRVSQHDTEKFFRFIGKPIKGFKYKWEYELRSKYNMLKKEVSYEW
jgi:hypothetical protein